MQTKIKPLFKSFLRSRTHALLNRASVSPWFVHFECTYRCNMKCTFCNVWRKSPDIIEATTSKLKQRLFECWDLGCLVASFTGGEPLLRSDLGQLLKFSNSNLGLFTGLVTNGLLLNKKVDDLSKYTDFLAVSFDVNNKEIFNQTRGVDAFDAVKNNIKYAKKLGIELDLFSVITRETFEFIDDTLEFAKSLELPIHFSPVDNVPRGSVDEACAEDLKILENSLVLKKLAEEKKNYSKIYFESDYFRFQSLGGFRNVIGCSSASTTVALKPDSSVALPCPFFTLMKVDTDENLKSSLCSEKAKNIIENCGNWDFCKNCSINCMYVASLLKHPYFLIRWAKNKL
ncbi:MAG: radical SAM protein [Candidatus Bathyarchaeota archaeon]|nr:MAG: radical SAM protein [Candidatus Bathyarchaeota archaeon]